jgi:hypothetical protein
VGYFEADTPCFDVHAMQMAPLLASLTSKVDQVSRFDYWLLAYLKRRNWYANKGSHASTRCAQKLPHLHVQGRTYNALVLSILLYDSEALCLGKILFNRLRSFRNRFIRSLCRITMAHKAKYRITFKTLSGCLGVIFFRQLLQPRHYYAGPVTLHACPWIRCRASF